MLRLIAAVIVAAAVYSAAGPARDWDVEIHQLTSGPNQHHFFGYIGHVQNIPWNKSGRYVVLLRTTFQDHMPQPEEAAEIVLLDMRRSVGIERLDETRGWNPQQGTMLYWNPKAQETQIFFNDRDPRTGKVFAVLYDVQQRRRLKEYRFEDTPVGNSGVAQKGGQFLGLNYGRLARLRPVTGYPQAYDWTEGVAAPENDGVFLINSETGVKRLIVSFRQLAEAVRTKRPDIDRIPLFINHTLWSRDDNRIYFYLRGHFANRADRVDIPFTVRPDGNNLTMHEQFIGGHPEWELGSRMIGAVGRKQVLYDVETKRIVDELGSEEIFPKPGGDVALSVDAKWLVNGHGESGKNFYTILHRPTGTWLRTRGFPNPGWDSGDLRLDPSPAWNRSNDAFLVPAIAADGTRQSFLIKIIRRK
jgi:hypothetical protein